MRPEKIAQALPLIVVDHTFPEEFVGHHRSANMPAFRKVTYSSGCLINFVSTNISQFCELSGRKEEPASNVVTKLFGGCRCIGSTYACLTQPDVAEFVKQREAPSGLHVLVVDDDKWCHIVRKRETSENLNFDIRVMAAEIAD
jgi:hypothetical protein